jgi:LacI family transcriptional regulator
MPTMRDIARAANVSIGTVSNYFNNPDLVAEDTRQAIRQAIQQVGYHPNAAARSLKTNQTLRLGLVPLISLEDNYSLDPGDYAFLEFLSGINTAAAEAGYDVLLSAATSTAQEVPIYERLVGEHQVDGLILMGMRAEDERLRLLRESRFPFICYGRGLQEASYAYIDVDGAAGIEKAVDYLVAHGHTRMAFITPPPGLACTVQRRQGFERGLQKHDLKLAPEYLEPGGFTERDGQAAMHLLLDLPQPPTAVLTANDVCAFGAMRAVQSRGLQVGQDVSVIGFDDIRLASHWQPPLTTIAQPFRRIGALCAENLIQCITNQDCLPQVLLEPNLVERQSVARLS